VGADCREHNCVITFLLQMKLHTLLSNMKHVEFQVLADKYGNVVHLGERDYSVQRRFQKLVEEAPCPIVSPFWRMKLGAAAIDVALALDYAGALTVEFFYFPETRKFYFSGIDSRV
jgi:acetyl-CoA carboxylase biotin carboxylase subunit